MEIYGVLYRGSYLYLKKACIGLFPKKNKSDKKIDLFPKKNKSDKKIDLFPKKNKSTGYFIGACIYQ